MNIELSIYVSYSQLAVFLPSKEEPYNAWTDDDVENGFSWRPGCVSFRTPEEAGDYLVRVRSHMPEDCAGGASGILVPFSVPAGGIVEVGSISDTKVIKIGAGDYMLKFEVLALQPNSIMLTFFRDGENEAQ